MVYYSALKTLLGTFVVKSRYIEMHTFVYNELTSS